MEMRALKTDAWMVNVCSLVWTVMMASPVPRIAVWTVNVSILARSVTMETLAKWANVIPPLVNVISLIVIAVTITLVPWTLAPMVCAAMKLWCAKMTMITCALYPVARMENVSPVTLFALMMTMMIALVAFVLMEVANSEAETVLGLWVLLRRKRSPCLLLRFLNLPLKFLPLPRFLLPLEEFLQSKVVLVVAMEVVVSLTALKNLLWEHGALES